tara:strand:- start:628 stop:744 length:117 start_codon:yes stop_codon:yes gene_type:complete
MRTSVGRLAFGRTVVAAGLVRERWEVEAAEERVALVAG